MNSFFEKLANHNPRGESSEHLKLLGKRAAGMFVRDEVEDLTSVVQAVVGEEELNREMNLPVTLAKGMVNQAILLFQKIGDLPAALIKASEACRIFEESGEQLELANSQKLLAAIQQRLNCR